MVDETRVSPKRGVALRWRHTASRSARRRARPVRATPQWRAFEERPAGHRVSPRVQSYGRSPPARSTQRRLSATESSGRIPRLVEERRVDLDAVATGALVLPD